MVTISKKVTTVPFCFSCVNIRLYKPAQIVMQVQEHQHKDNQIGFVYEVDKSSPQLIVQDGDEEVRGQVYVRPGGGEVVEGVEEDDC